MLQLHSWGIDILSIIMRSDIDQLIERVRGKYQTTGLRPATPEQIARAEAALGVALPPSYRAVVSTLPPPRSSGLAWIGGPKLPKYQDIVQQSRDGRNLPLCLVSLLETGDGDQICLDTRHPDADGEYPMVWFRHEINDENSSEFEPFLQTLPEILEANLTPPKHSR